MKVNSSPSSLPGNANYPYGKVFGNKLQLHLPKDDIETDLGNINKIRLYASDSYIYNIMLLAVALLLFAAAAIYMKTKTTTVLVAAAGAVALFYAFRIRVTVFSIMINLRKNNETINLRVKEKDRKIAEDFIFYVNGEILKQDKIRYNSAASARGRLQ
jgi:hypothetical protein